MSTATDPLISLPELYKAEAEAADLIIQLQREPVDTVNTITQNLKFKQPLAVGNACQQSLSILTGPPGTGKTTTTKQIVRSLNAAGLTGIIISPTGKAAKRADQVVNDTEKLIKTSTVHVGLSWNKVTGGFNFNKENHLKYDYVIIDEFPMQGIQLFLSVLRAINPKRTRLILVGDQHQLPSIEPGNIARDILATKLFKTVELVEILRQGADSGIVYNASRILRGDMISALDDNGIKFTDFFFVPRKDAAESAKFIIESVVEKIPKKFGFNSLTDIQVLAPGKKSVVGTKNLNDTLRKELNNTVGEEFNGFRVGDKVINKKNDYNLGVVNGDTGIVEEVGNTGIVVNFGPGSGTSVDENGIGNGIVIVEGEKIQQLELSYAYTVHKSQGSEYPVVIIPLHLAHYTLLFRNLLYTGETRGRKLVILVGDYKALDVAINNNMVVRRQTRFKDLIICKASGLKVV